MFLEVFQYYFTGGVKDTLGALHLEGSLQRIPVDLVAHGIFFFQNFRQRDLLALPLLSVQ